MNTTIEIQTRYNKDLIEQSILYPNDSLITQTTKQIIQLQDQAVKDALKKLGWLNPEEAQRLFLAADILRNPWENRDTLLAEEVVVKIFKEYFGGQE